MFKKINLSLRYKILLLLTLLPIITLALFLVLALEIFEDDKVAYVFESSSSVSKTLASQVTTDLNSALSSSRPIIQEFVSEGQFGLISRSLFDAESVIDWVAVYSEKEDQFLGAGLIEKTPGIAKEQIEKIQNLNGYLREALAQGRAIKVPFNDERVLFIEKVNTPNGERLFALGARLKELSDVFLSPSSSEIFLIDEKGEVLLTNSEKTLKNLSEKTPIEFVEKLKNQKFTTGTEEVLSLSGIAWLASFSKVSIGNLFVINLVPKAEALKAVQILIKKSLVFFLFLISATVIISLFASSTMTAALTDLFQATKKVGEGHFDIRVNVKSSDEIGSLAESFNAMAGEVSRLMLETAEKARMESELKTAQTVQETLFPADYAEMNGFIVAGHYEPASECGGDWWHYCQVDKKIFLWIGDATGHGAPAALITSAAKSAATIIEKLNIEPAAALTLMNRAIFDVSKGKIMMTFFLACFDLETREFIYANASHEAPYLIKIQEEQLKKKNLIPLNEVNNPRLGQSRETEYQQTKLKLDLGDRIFFYTDGLPDIQDPENKPWGEREFIKAILSSNQGYPPIKNCVDVIVNEFSNYRKGSVLIDDITFFMCHYQGDSIETNNA